MKISLKRWLVLLAPLMLLGGNIFADAQEAAMGKLREGNIIALEAEHGKKLVVGSEGALVEWPNSITATYEGEPEDNEAAQFRVLRLKVDDKEIVGFKSVKTGMNVQVVPGNVPPAWILRAENENFADPFHTWEHFEVVDGKYLKNRGDARAAEGTMGGYVTRPFKDDENVAHRDRVRFHDSDGSDGWQVAEKKDAEVFKIIVLEEAGVVAPAEWNKEEADAQRLGVGSRDGKLEAWLLDADGDLYGYDSKTLAADPWIRKINEKDAEGKDLKFEDISVSSDGNVVVLSDSKAYEYDFDAGHFVLLPAGEGNEALMFEHISIGNEETLVGDDFNNNLWQYNFEKNAWEELEKGIAAEAAAGLDGTIVAFNLEGEVYIREGDAWNELPGIEAKRIAIANKDIIYVIDVEGRLNRWVAAEEKWEAIESAGLAELGVNAAGTAFVATHAGHTFNNKEDGVEITEEKVVEGKVVKKAKKVIAKQTRKQKKKKKQVKKKRGKKKKKAKKQLKKRKGKKLRKKKKKAKKKKVKKADKGKKKKVGKKKRQKKNAGAKKKKGKKKKFRRKKGKKKKVHRKKKGKKGKKRRRKKARDAKSTAEATAIAKQAAVDAQDAAAEGDVEGAEEAAAEADEAAALAQELAEDEIDEVIADDAASAADDAVDAVDEAAEEE